MHETSVAARDATAPLSYDALATIVDAIDDAVIAHALDGKILTWNAGAARILGHSAAEAIGARVDRLLGEETTEPRIDFAAAFAKGESPAPFEATVHRKNGEPVRVAITLKPIHDATGKLAGVTRIVRDLGERVAAQARIARMNRGYAVLRAINAAIVRIRDRTELLEEACHVAVAQGGFRMAWVGLSGAAPHDPVVVLAHAGDERGFLSRVRVILDRDAPGGRGVAAAAMVDNRTAVDNDIAANHG